jgi:hypothetical protein
MRGSGKSPSSPSPNPPEIKPNGIGAQEKQPSEIALNRQHSCGFPGFCRADYIDTEINHHHWETEQGQKLISMLPRKRVGQPQDPDALLMLLASDQSHFINGAVIAANNGFAV